ncbi:MAG: hypothetical protein ACRCZP_04685 [Phycicoccus sp.]
MTTTRPGASTLERVMEARAAVLVVFALSGAAFASWAARIADAKVALDLSAGELGTTLVGTSLGAVVGLPLAGRVTQRFGSARTVAAAAARTLTGVLLFGVVVDTAGSRWAAAGALFLVGLGNGVWDVAMNLEGAEVERGLARSVMPHFHAAYSGGTSAWSSSVRPCCGGRYVASSLGPSSGPPVRVARRSPTVRMPPRQHRAPARPGSSRAPC